MDGLGDGLAMEGGETRASRETPLVYGLIGWQCHPCDREESVAQSNAMSLKITA